MTRATRVTPTLSDMPHGTRGSDIVADNVDEILMAKETLSAIRV